MTKIAIVTDSTAYLPAETMKGLPIHVIPLQLVWGEETFQDGVDIQPEEFYERLKTAKVLPSTSQPSPAAFLDVYTRLHDQDYEILSVHISSRLSGTLDSAAQAKAMLPKAKIELVDSLSAGLSLGFPVLMAARLVSQGATLSEAKILTEQAVKHTGVFLAVRTLEFLHRGGRLGGAAAMLGTILNLKPILNIEDGSIHAVEKVRSMSKALDRLLDLLEAKVEHNRTPIRLACLYTDNKPEAEMLMERARQRFNVSEVAETVIAPVSPVIGTHIGPGALGLCFMAGI